MPFHQAVEVGGMIDVPALKPIVDRMRRADDTERMAGLLERLTG